MTTSPSQLSNRKFILASLRSILARANAPLTCKELAAIVYDKRIKRRQARRKTHSVTNLPSGPFPWEVFAVAGALDMVKGSYLRLWMPAHQCCGWVREELWYRLEAAGLIGPEKEWPKASLFHAWEESEALDGGERVVYV